MEDTTNKKKKKKRKTIRVPRIFFLEFLKTPFFFHFVSNLLFFERKKKFCILIIERKTQNGEGNSREDSYLGIVRASLMIGKKDPKLENFQDLFIFFFWLSDKTFLTSEMKNLCLIGV